MMSAVWRKLVKQRQKDKDPLQTVKRDASTPEGLDHLQRRDTASDDLPNVVAPQLCLDLLQQIWPLLREIARDDVFKNVCKLDTDASRRRGGEEWQERGLEGSAVRGGDRDLISSGIGGIDEV